MAAFALEPLLLTGAGSLRCMNQLREAKCRPSVVCLSARPCTPTAYSGCAAGTSPTTRPGLRHQRHREGRCFEPSRRDGLPGVAHAQGGGGDLKEAEAETLVAEAGDMVSVHYSVTTEDGQHMLSSSEGEEPLTFEVGAGNVMGNPLFQSFDAVVLGLSVGQTESFRSVAGERDADLVFSVPKSHEEVQRLQEASEEPLRAGTLVFLSNGQPAVILAVDDDQVRIDANHPLAGTMLQFQVRLVSVEKAST